MRNGKGVGFPGREKGEREARRGATKRRREGYSGQKKQMYKRRRTPVHSGTQARAWRACAVLNRSTRMLLPPAWSSARMCCRLRPAGWESPESAGQDSTPNITERARAALLFQVAAGRNCPVLNKACSQAWGGHPANCLITRPVHPGVAACQAVDPSSQQAACPSRLAPYRLSNPET